MNLFSNTNLKQFEFIKYVAENAGDEHVMAKIIIRLRYDKVEAPYYMETRIRISSCADLQDNGDYIIMTKSLEELEEVFKIYGDFFKTIDDLV